MRPSHLVHSMGPSSVNAGARDPDATTHSPSKRMLKKSASSLLSLADV
jgi:hypothetical protein